MSLNLHKDREWFLAALEFTSRQTGFRIDLIEKDYYCSLVLDYLFRDASQLVFKGGTSLNKVHLGFYRLSEDLDFTIPAESNLSREDRRAAVKPFKKILTDLKGNLPEIRIKQDLAGSNESKQYNAELEYTSIGSGSNSSIKVEVGLRERPLLASSRLHAHTVLLDPFSGAEAVAPVEVQCLPRDEAYSEKVRAALTRREPAIRDWFDLDHAATIAGFNFERPEFLELVRKKLRVPGNRVYDNEENVAQELKSQLETELQPVLRDKDFSSFDLQRALATVAQIRKNLKC